MSTHASADVKPFRRALVSVFYKDGLEPLLRRLASLGVELLSTGGTHAYIESVGLHAEKVESLTGYPSILGGRVKTLHPAVFGGILQRPDYEPDAVDAARHNIPGIDLVIVNLYPFEETLQAGGTHEEIIEKIDIGGISLIRAGAKNYRHVATLSDPEQYEELLEILDERGAATSLEERKVFAFDAFATSSAYDNAIAEYFLETLSAEGSIEMEEEPEEQTEAGATTLRYGENPHQPARFVGDLAEAFSQLHGRELSYNNLLDLDAALALVEDFAPEAAHRTWCCAIIKHNNACGIALDADPQQAWQKALAADPISAFGGVIVFNTTVTEALARQVDEIFFEILAAPTFEGAAVEIFQKKKNRILLQTRPFNRPPESIRTALSGVLVQTPDTAVEIAAELRTVTAKAPTAQQIEDMLLAARICKHTKSNAIVLARDGALIASGTGQTSRVDALRQAIAKAQGFGLPLHGAAMASDAFFPFPDCVQIAAEAGIEAIIQPGGSVKDGESIAAADAAGIAMVMSGRRHFKH